MINSIHRSNNISKISCIKNNKFFSDMRLLNFNKSMLLGHHLDSNKKNSFIVMNANHNKDISNKNINIQKNKMHELSYNNTNKIDNILQELSVTGKNNKKSIFHVFKNFLYVNNRNNRINWKKAITQQILFSIFNKKNTAEIHVTPKNLGPIYIQIQMQDKNVIINLASSNVYINNILNSSIESLKKYLIKSGIRLGKINIYSGLIEDSIKTTKTDHFNNIKQKKCSPKNYLKNPWIFQNQKTYHFDYNKIDMYV